VRWLGVGDIIMSTTKLTSLFLAITIVGVLHMSEQVLFGVEEFHMLKTAIGGWWTLFPATYADEASVILITIVFTTMSLLVYAAMCGGRSALLVAALFGVLGVQEAHHWIEAIETRAYDPGLVTSFAYVWVGALILMNVFRAVRQQPSRQLAAA
jgi:hypothetical protein